MRLRKPVLRALAEQEDRGLGERAVPAKQAPCLERSTVISGRTDRLAKLGELFGVEVLDGGTGGRFVFELCAAAVVVELTALGVGELLRFVSDAQEHVAVHGLVDVLARRDVDAEDGAVAIEWQSIDVCAHRRNREIDPGLSERVLLVDGDHITPGAAPPEPSRAPGPWAPRARTTGSG
ncbi:hypothetical protein CFK39_10685 [Brachybacterium avium]|uniref:Uncharacterized protein n=1 Tax=Brachybacterium avium TaxID=2017485 RepID=A0A220UDB3_9MICO|nr:hypothetical protein CFK39_10685 [Brachybacterium avium]